MTGDLRVGGAPHAAAREWVVVIPVKRAELGKTRLRVLGVEREALARAIALDTVAAAAACPRVAEVLVVTSDEVTAAALLPMARVRLVRDRGDGLTAAIERGLSAAPARLPRAVLLGDLPALLPDELSRALDYASGYPRGFVPDAEGTGTVLATARADVPLRPCFGADSAAAHRAAGFAEVGFPVRSGLRRDLDHADHLHTARSCGLGPRTAALLEPRLVAAS